MTGILEPRSHNYSHGIVSQNCFAKLYSDAVIEVKQLIPGTFVQVHSVQDDDVFFCIVHDDMQVEPNQMVCKRGDIINVPENLWGPLFTVKRVERLSLVKDTKVAESLGNLSVGHIVQVLGPDNTVICKANITFRNSIGRLGVGIFFGLKILNPKENLQTLVEKVSLLEPATKGFPRDCDVVVTIDKIRPSHCNFTKDKLVSKYDKENQQLLKNFSSGEDIMNGTFKSMSSYDVKDKFSSSCKKVQFMNIPETSGFKSHFGIKKMNSDSLLSVGDEVVYLNGDIPEKGIVRWTGLIENSPKVKVEFDNATGNSKGCVDVLGELLGSKVQQASVVSPMALIKLSDYLMNTSKETTHFLKKSSNNTNSNNNNHNNSNNNNNNNNNNHHHHHHKNNNNNHSSNSNNSNNNNNYNNNNHNNNNNNNTNSNINNNNNSNNNNNNSITFGIKTNNNNNNIAVDDDFVKSNEICYERSQNFEEKCRKSRKLLASNPCLKHFDKTYDLDDSFQTSNKSVKESFKNDVKPDQRFDVEMPQNSKGYDFVSSNEKKTVQKKRFESEEDPNSFLSRANLTPLPLWTCQSHEFHDSGEVKLEKSHNPFGSHVESTDSPLHKVDLIHPNEIESRNFLEQGERDAEHSNGKEFFPEECDFWKASHSENYALEDLGKGSVVELIFRGEPHYGVIRWIGSFSEEKEENSPRLIAGIEMEEECPGFTDGTFNNKRYFQCNPRKALFVPLSRCRKDSRFSEESQKFNLPSKVNYGQIDCPVVEGTLPPINRKGDIELICGKNRGIQGHHNSCYLDATLFSMFAFTSVFDSLLYRPPSKNDIPQYSEVQRVLRDEIVNPLRKNLYVRADRVMKLRTLLEKLSSISGLTSEEKDPEEFLNSLLAQILKAEPFLKLSSGQEAFHYQLFVEKDERLIWPSVQQLFEQSFVASDIKLKQVPSCLIIQMPRFGKSFKMYSKIMPPRLLDITDIIENSPRQCTVCGKLAQFECKDCFGQQGIGNGLESISYCKTCLETAHNHHCRNRHNSRALTVPLEFYELQDHCVIPRLSMELFAVVCIETSHYVAFVKCGAGADAPWCFFDSMADRKGEENGYNIPELVPCPDLPYWLSEDGAKMLNEMRDDRQLSEHAKRLFSDAYMCMYQSPDLMMYR